MGIPWLSDNGGKPWNSGTLGGVSLPGIVSVGVTCSDEVEVKKPKGINGASTTFQGREPAEIEIVLSLHDDGEGSGAAQFAALQKLLDVVRPRVTKDAKKASSALAFVHPKADLYRIAAVICRKISDPPDTEADRKKISLSCVEFIPPVKGGASATKTEKSLDPRKQSLAEDLTDTPPSKVPLR